MQDNDQLTALQVKCPHGTSVVMQIVNVPDFFSRARAYDHSRVFVACEGEQLVGSAACAIRDSYVDGKLMPVGYLFEAFVDPACRRKGVASLLCKTREDYLQQHDAALIFTLIMEGNVPSMRYIEHKGYRHHRKITATGLHVFEEMPVPHAEAIRQATPDDLGAVAELLNETWQGYDLYVPASPESLTASIERTPGFSLENLLLFEQDGDILACCGYWDWARVMEITVLELNARMRLDSALLTAFRLFKPMPRATRKGDRLRPMVLTPIGFRDPTHIGSLVRHMNNLAVHKNNDMIYCVCEPGHSLLQGLRGFHQVEIDLHLYVKAYDPSLKMDRPTFVSGRDL